MIETTVGLISVDTFEVQQFSTADTSNITQQTVDSEFNTTKDRIELYVYDSAQNLIYSDYNYTAWTAYQGTEVLNQTNINNIYVDPGLDLQEIQDSDGTYYLIYNFVENKLLSSADSTFYITEISADRTEISLQSNTLDDQTIQSLVNEFRQELQTGEYFEEFYLNLFDNIQLIGVNIRTSTAASPTNIQVKLYEPLPTTVALKDQLWIQTRVAEPVGYYVVLENVFTLPDTTIKIKGPNYNIPLAREVSNSTSFTNYTQVQATNLSSSKNELNYLLNQSGATLNIDYSNFSNFVHFSSATQRLFNFYLKASLLEDYQNKIDALTAAASSTVKNSSIEYYENLTSDIIKNFDGYEYYLYYGSGSTSWPKTNSTPPYTLAATGSTAVINWYGTSGIDGSGILQSASIYDNENQDNLIYSIPQFIREDSDNGPGELFVEMLGQHFDNLYLYTDNITQKYNADNRLDYGISKDLVADTLRSFGVKLYENNFSTNDLYTALIGLTPSGSTLPLPDISTIFPVVGEGNEYIETIISASNDIIPLDDLNKSVYKRLYHNLPALVKKKGTLDGLRLLINSFGIPDTILRISEFGGKDKVNANDWDYWQHDFNYKYELDGQNDFATTEWALNTDWNANNDRPAALAFRFSTDEVITSAPTNVSQSLWWSSTAPPSYTTKYSAITLTYTGSAGTSGSYSGSVVDPYYQYGTLTFFPNYADTTVSASVYLPFFDGGWWSVLVNSGSDGMYTLHAKNSIYNGNTGTALGFQASSSVTPGTNTWISGSYSVFGNSVDTYSRLSGSLQEIRYYINAISESVFDDYVMNPASSEGNSINSSPNELAFRGALGNELYTGSVSIHPKVAGGEPTSSFASNSSIVFTGGTFTSDTGYRFLDQPAVGIKNRIADKIRTVDSTLYGTTLSTFRSLEQTTPSTKNYTRDVNYLEVGFSPQNEINDDIIGQTGFFNIGEYIGDPRQISSSTYSYPDLDSLRNDYFKKYTKSYDFNDYLRLIKFFDNSLFRMIKDFIPARTGAATGAIIKQNLLERNRQRPAQLTFTQPEYTASIPMETFSGGPGGVMDRYQTSNQAWTSSIFTKAGIVTEIHSDRSELFTGELSGSVIDVVNGNLLDNPLLAPSYRLSVPDLQNLNISTTASVWGYAADISAGFYRDSGSMAFNEYIDTIDYYNTSTYSYTPGYKVLANMDLYVSGAFKQAGGSSTLYTLDVSLLEGNTVLTTKRTAIDTGTIDPNPQQFEFNLTLENITLQPEKTYTVYYNMLSDDEFELAAGQDSYWRIDTVNTYAQSTYYLDPTVKAQQLFPGNLETVNDYNAIYNNVYSNRVSSTFQQVDNQQNALTPTNFANIVSGSAIYAQVQDSNYALNSAFSNLRFAGKQQTVPGFNEGRELNNRPVVGDRGSYMLFYDWGGSSLAERSGSANVHIQYLIDEEGTLYSPNAVSSSLYYTTVNQLFTKNYPVNITTYNAASNTALSQTVGVYQPLKLVQPILYSDTGSLGNDYLVSGSYSSLSFTYKKSFTPFDGLFTLNSDQNIGGFGIESASVEFNDVIKDAAGGLNTGTYTYTVQFDTPVKATIDANFDVIGLGGPGNDSFVTINLYENGQFLKGDSGSVDGGGAIVTDLNINVPYLNFTSGSEYIFQVTESYGEAARLVGGNCTWAIIPYINSSGVNAPYWTTGQTVDIVLTSSALWSVYSSGFTQNTKEGSGFGDCLTFDLKYLDEIRYEGNEGLIYTITSASYDSSNMYVFLDRPINTQSININYFLIRRNVQDAGFVMLNTPTTQIPGPGFITPKYPSLQLSNNFDSIVKDFAEKNLI